MRKTQHHICDISDKGPQPESNHEETSDKCKLRSSLQNNWPVIFKGVKVMKILEILRTEGYFRET